MFQEIGTADQLADNFLQKTVEFYTNEYRKKRCIHIVCERDSLILGCAGGILRRDEFLSMSFKKPDYGYVMDVYVMPEYRREGIAKGMIEMLLPWFKSSGVPVVNLDASKISGDLYQKLGFTPSIQLTWKFNLIKSPLEPTGDDKFQN